MTKSGWLTVLSLCLLAGPAFAQAPGAMRGEGTVRVQSSISFFLAGPTGDGEEAAKLREHARSMVYEMAAHECDVLRRALAKDCRLEAVTSNTNVTRPYGQQTEGYNVNGSMSFQITLK